MQNKKDPVPSKYLNPAHILVSPMSVKKEEVKKNFEMSKKDTLTNMKERMKGLRES
jgi:hypothetical protein